MAYTCYIPDKIDDHSYLKGLPCTIFSLLGLSQVQYRSGVYGIHHLFLPAVVTGAGGVVGVDSNVYLYTVCTNVLCTALQCRAFQKFVLKFVLTSTVAPAPLPQGLPSKVSLAIIYSPTMCFTCGFCGQRIDIHSQLCIHSH